MEIASATEYCPITRLHQKLQVFVEYVKLADSEDVWCLSDTSIPDPNVRYIVPKKNVTQELILSSEYPKKDNSISTLRLSVKHPYRIEIEEVGWLYTGLLHGSDELGEMIAFNPAEVSFRLDPIKNGSKV